MRRAVRTRLTLLVVVLLGAVAGACGGGSGTKATSTLDWTAPLLAGGRFEAGDYAGKPVAFWFWAPT